MASEQRCLYNDKYKILAFPEHRIWKRPDASHHPHIHTHSHHFHPLASPLSLMVPSLPTISGLLQYRSLQSYQWSCILHAMTPWHTGSRTVPRDWSIVFQTSARFMSALQVWMVVGVSLTTYKCVQDLLRTKRVWEHLEANDVCVVWLWTMTSRECDEGVVWGQAEDSIVVALNGTIWARARSWSLFNHFVCFCCLARCHVYCWIFSIDVRCVNMVSNWIGILLKLVGLQGYCGRIYAEHCKWLWVSGLTVNDSVTKMISSWLG